MKESGVPLPPSQPEPPSQLKVTGVVVFYLVAAIVVSDSREAHPLCRVLLDLESLLFKLRHRLEG